MKFALDIGNSTIKVTVLDNKNTLLSNILSPSVVNTVAHEKYLTFDNDEIYFKVEDSPLNHYDEIVCISDIALARPNYSEYDVTSTSYKSNHKITTSLIFGTILSMVEKSTSIKLVVSIPIVE